ncbi:MAG TPA: PQQ-dependent dehydrogenase, methanol/ethanol family [Gammaproteobacteria bacterium]|jgi:PQQ-dependent dehydrogenase (methanol/ethanol family)|nr:PQQ-dependent dehydrogenase, methanol/ethanol family [Gammaproteobacteria bacterium]
MNKSFPIFTVGAIVLAVLIYFFYNSKESQGGVIEDEISSPITSSSSVGLIDDKRIIEAEGEPENWIAHGRTYEEQRFSPLTKINKESVSDLGLAWYKDMGTNRALEATPIVVDGIMFFTSTWSRVYAVEAKTGETLWSFDPEVPGEWARKACCDIVNRGVAVYQGKVFFASLDGRLFSLNAETGEKIWEVDTITDRTRAYTITGAPRVAKGKVYIGNGGAEYGVRGYVTAYDTETGEQVWRFFTVPGDPSLGFEDPAMEMAAKTWKGTNWWEFGGGGTVWNSIVYDPDFNNIYLGVGNGSPWTREIRSPGGGDNLFLASIVAVDADTGKYKWHYQTTPEDNWDYTAVQDMALADMEVDGEKKKVLLQAPKNGFFYVIDRSNGKVLRAHPFAAVTWATHVDLETGRPVENPEVDYSENGSFVLPGPLGAHNWQAMSVDLDAGLVYIPAQENAFFYAIDENYKKTGIYKRNPGRWNMGIEMSSLAQNVLSNLESMPEPGGFLKAFDPLTGETKWSVPIPHYWNGGVLGTAGGLVFQGDALGIFSAYDKETGERLWEFNTYTSMLAPPISFEIDGEQYVSILTGSGGGDLFGGEPLPPIEIQASLTYNNFGRLLVFKLGGQKELPIPDVRDKTIPEQVLADASNDQIRNGESNYNQYCAVCHGFVVKSAGGLPDLRKMTTGTHDLFNKIVLEGILGSNGMAGFADVLSEDDVDNIHHYVRARAHEDREVSLGNMEAPQFTWYGVED